MTRTRIMYVEDKSKSLNGPARIGRVRFSRSGRTLTYQGRTFRPLKPCGYKANYEDVASGKRYWISGPRKDGLDRLYPESTRPVHIDNDVADEYWRTIRRLPRPRD